MIISVTGINWGDEGKGRVIDQLSGNADIVARYQGGDNAGHTVVNERGRFILNLIPSGIFHEGTVCVLGTGMVIDLEHLKGEIDSLRKRGLRVTPDNLKVSERATISMPWHVLQDGLEEERLSKSGRAFGSTRRGIAYAYGDKYKKKTLRTGDLIHWERTDVRERIEMILEAKNLELAGLYGQAMIIGTEALNQWCAGHAWLRPFLADTGNYLMQAEEKEETIILEAQLGALRDIDYGIFPYTSSSNTVSSYAPVGAGILNGKNDHVVGVMKAYSTCVGAGPFPAGKAMNPEWMDKLRMAGDEYGAATGRPRRVGPFDSVASRYGLRCQNADKVALTKLDVLSSFDRIPVISGYQINGKECPDFSPMDDLEYAKPKLEMLPGWKCDISSCRSWSELPYAAKGYVKALEEMTGSRIEFISVGPKREQFLLKGEWL
ncbi:MAG TPA: adenylosuccinate synthase [Lachnospiraceae bacterium]|nr:adenylosuccinate synthase [Lachnospiraceae bacterium]